MKRRLAIVLLALVCVSSGAAATSYEPLYPMVAPNGAQIAWVEGATWRIWIANQDGSGAHAFGPSFKNAGMTQVAWTRHGMVVDSNFRLVLLSRDGKHLTTLSPAGFSFAFGGSRVASGPERAPGTLVVADLITHRTWRMGSPQVNNSGAALSPDGTRVVWDGGDSLWTARVGGKPKRLALNGSCPQWSPDGRSIAYLSLPDDALLVKPSGGGGSKVLVAHAFTGCNVPGAPAWSPDSKSVAFERKNRLAIVDVASLRTLRSTMPVTGGFTWAHDASSLVVASRPASRERAGDNCTNLWRLDAQSLRGAIVVRGCP